MDTKRFNLFFKRIYFGLIGIFKFILPSRKDLLMVRDNIILEIIERGYLLPESRDYLVRFFKRTADGEFLGVQKDISKDETTNDCNNKSLFYHDVPRTLN